MDIPTITARLAAGLLSIAIAYAGKDHPPDAAAKAAFARVEEAVLPSAGDLFQCSVTQLQVMKTGRTQRAASIPRESYCRFLLALMNGAPAGDAAAGFRKARGDGNNRMAPLLAVLAGIAELHSGRSVADLPAKSALVDCAHTDFVSERSCRSILEAAAAWGAPPPAEPWAVALDRGEWARAAGLIEEAQASPPIATLAVLLGPQRRQPDLIPKLAWARFMQGDFVRALPLLDRAIAAHPDDAHTLFLRARIREDLGLTAPALLDLQDAANASPAPFYRAVLLLHQGNGEGAAAALAEAPPQTRDLEAWKLYAQACSAPPARLREVASNASPMFPKEQARGLAFDCALKQADTLSRLIDQEGMLREFQTQPDAMQRVSTAYLKYGLAAEDRQDNAAAADAYKRAAEWYPANTRARFNLGALYIGRQAYDLAEREYRALLAADPADSEAQYWLAQSILAPGPDTARRVEACGLLRESLRIADPSKRREFQAAEAVSCRPSAP